MSRYRNLVPALCVCLSLSGCGPSPPWLIEAMHGDHEPPSDVATLTPLTAFLGPSLFTPPHRVKLRSVDGRVMHRAEVLEVIPGLHEVEIELTKDRPFMFPPYRTLGIRSVTFTAKAGHVYVFLAYSDEDEMWVSVRDCKTKNTVAGTLPERVLINCPCVSGWLVKSGIARCEYEYR